MIIKPTVSVIVNCHNGETYLKKCINSVISQSYKNWEIIFFDNNSTDSSKKILDKFKDKRIKYFFSPKKLNLYHARNHAVSKSKGKYICFLDTDDYWKKNKIKKQIDFLRKNKQFNVIYSNYDILKNNKTIKTYSSMMPQGKIYDNLKDEYCIGIVTVCLERKIFKKYKFNNKYNIIGDFEFFLKISKKYNFGYQKDSLACYRIHKNNYSIKKVDLYLKELSDWSKRNNESLSMNLRIFIVKLFIKKFIKKLGM